MTSTESYKWGETFSQVSRTVGKTCELPTTNSPHNLYFHGGGWVAEKCQSVSLFITFRHTDTKWTQSLTIFLSLSETQSDPKVIKSFF